MVKKGGEKEGGAGVTVLWILVRGGKVFKKGKTSSVYMLFIIGK